jgi:4-amino-4-deoxy-L-arabinose transferase-like glycosyltransferase
MAGGEAERSPQGPASASGQGRLVRTAVLLAFLGAGFAVQAYFFAAFPQPVLFGDPRGYHEAGQRLQDAASRLAAGEDAGTVFESVRGLLFLAGVGSLFAVVDAMRPGDLAFFRLVLAGFNTATMLGVFLLARRLEGSRLAGFLALGLAVVYPAFSVQTGRLYPDPVTGCLFTWAALAWLAGVQDGRRAPLVAAGLLLGAAALVRSQLALYLLGTLALTLLASAPAWVRARATRRQAAAFALALLPLAAAWGGIEWAVGARDEVTRFGNLTFRPPYPYGFWQFLDADGWSTAYRFKSEPYYRALLEENERRPGLFASSARQIAFTARYAGARPADSAGIVLNNVYRLLDRPANDYKWDYPLSYPVQVWLQRAVVVAALAGLALFGAESLATAGVFFVPASLVVLHGLTFTWPRYNVPFMPILMAAAGAAVARLCRSGGRNPRRSHGLLVALGLGFAGLGLGRLVAPAAPQGAAILGLGGLLAALATPFLAVGAKAGSLRAGRWAAGAWGSLALVVTAHAARDRQWHETHLRLGADVGQVEQRIRLEAAAVDRLRGASEAFVALDLALPRGDTRFLEIEVGGRRHTGAELTPTMPRLPESTSTGGRDWRGYPQWWVVPLDGRTLAAGAPAEIVVRLRVRPGAEGRLGADRFPDQERVYEGPSLGERPYMVALKLEYDGDYRVPRAYPLGSAGTRTTVQDPRGRRRSFRGVARIRLVTLDRNEGGTTWRTAAAPGPRAAFGFFAYAGERGQASLRVKGREALRVPLGSAGDYEVDSPPWRLCRRALGIRGDKRYDAFVLVGPAVAGRPLDLGVSFRTGMSERPMYFMVDRRRAFEDLDPYLTACGIERGVPRAAGVAEVVDASRNSYPDDTGYWTVREVF